MENNSQGNFNDIFVFTPFVASDYRGHLCKVYSEKMLQAEGVSFVPVEETIINSHKNVLRGMHFQKVSPPAKLISCITGDIQLVLIDLCKDDLLFGKWKSYSMSRHDTMIIPGYYAVGTYAKEESFIYVGYDNDFLPECQAGVKWNDPEVSIEWENNNPIVSDRDKELPYLREIDL